MAAADYRLCDVCNGKVFCDAKLNYNETQEENDPEAFRIAGHVEPWGARLDYLGDWAVICSDCAKTHKTIVVPLYAAPVVPQAEPKREPLSEKQIADACLRYRHDFGLLDKYERDCIVNEAWRWADAFGIGGSDER